MLTKCVILKIQKKVTVEKIKQEIEFEKGFYYCLFKWNIPGEGESIHNKLPVPIGSVKKLEMNDIHPHAP